MQIAQNSIVFSAGNMKLSLGDSCKIGAGILMYEDKPLWLLGNRCGSGA